MIEHSYILRSEAVRSRLLLALGAIRIDPAKPMEVNVRPYKKRRSNAANARYWAVLHQIGDAFGSDADELHDFCKRKFLGVDRVELMGSVEECARSTSKLSTEEFAQYVDRVEMFAASELGILLPAL